MGQNKEELNKLLSFIEALTKQPGNEEFVAGLRALLLSETPGIEKAKLEEIYEYCIERNSRNQATDFYKNFPIKELRNELVESYVLMESFRRRGDFLNFCAHLFKQIEGAANYICNLPEYQKIFTNLLDCPAVIKYNQDPALLMVSRDPKSPTVPMLIYEGFGQNTDGTHKKDIPLKKQYIQDRIKIAMYLAGYASCLYSQNEFKSFSFNLSKLYLARCEADHSGNSRTEKQDVTFRETIANPGKYYIEFMALLNSVISKVSAGFLAKDALFKFAASYGVEECEGIVSSALPSALYVKVDNGNASSVPSTAYDHSAKFENGMKVRVTRKQGIIVNVIPSPQEEVIEE